MSEENDQALADKPDDDATAEDIKQPLFSDRSRMGDVGLTVFAVVWALVVIAVGMMMQG